MNETYYASYGSLVVQHPRAYVMIPKPIEEDPELERLRAQLAYEQIVYHRRACIVMAVTPLIPVLMMAMYVAFLWLRIR